MFASKQLLEEEAWGLSSYEKIDCPCVVAEINIVGGEVGSRNCFHHLLKSGRYLVTYLWIVIRRQILVADAVDERLHHVNDIFTAPLVDLVALVGNFVEVGGAGRVLNLRR